MNALKGTGVAIITPFTKKGTIDFECLGSLIDFIVGNGVNYIVSLGTTGESSVLSAAEKTDIIHFTAQQIAGRCPLVVGCGGASTLAVAEELQTMPLENATAVLSVSPYYNKPSQEGIFQHYKLIAAASPKPIVLYNVPARTGRNMSVETILRIAHELPNVCGIKEASGDMEQCMKLLLNAPSHFQIISGDDMLALPQIACGMTGVISVAANVFPNLISEMIRLCLEGDFVSARSINNRLIPAYNLMFEENNPAGVKAMLAVKGIIENKLRLPLVPVSDGLQQSIIAWMEKNQMV